jgi:hypothetical protein
VDGRRAREVTLSPETLPRLRRHEPRPLPLVWAVLVGAGWPLLLVAMMAVAPAPTDPEAVPSLLDSLGFLALVVGLAGTVGAAVGRHRKALLWSTGLGVVWVASTLTCPLSGHHETVGWQWYTDLGASSALLLASVVGLRLLRHAR